MALAVAKGIHHLEGEASALPKLLIKCLRHQALRRVTIKKVLDEVRDLRPQVRVKDVGAAWIRDAGENAVLDLQRLGGIVKLLGQL